MTLLKPPFDILGDLDTPVSAFMKLGALNPRFLLESVEGGERLARYSFIGFGDCLELKVGQSGVTIGGQTEPLPASAAELLN
jgi:anthranilate synthase component 1